MCQPSVLPRIAARDGADALLSFASQLKQRRPLVGEEQQYDSKRLESSPIENGQSIEDVSET